MKTRFISFGELLTVVAVAVLFWALLSPLASRGAVAATPGSALWAKRFGATLSDYGHAVAVAPSGAIVLGAQSYAQQVAYGGPILGGGAIVASYTGTGAHVWSQSLNWLASTEAVVTDAAGNIYVAGQFQNSFQVGATTLTSAGSWDVFLVALTPSGSPRWAKRFGSDLAEFLWGLAVAPDGSVVLVADGWSRSDYGGGIVPGSRVVARYSSMGQHLWSRSLYTMGSAVPQAIAATNASVVVGGRMSGTMDFGTGQFSTTGTDGFVAAFALASGAPQWVRPVSASGTATILALAGDPIGAIMAGGSFIGTLGLGGQNIGAQGARDAVITRLGTNGDVLWVRTAKDAETTALATDASANVVAGGNYRADTDLGTGGLPRIGSQSGFLAEYTAANVPLWAHGYVGDATVNVESVAVDPVTQDIVMSGSFNSQVYLGTALLFSAGEYDAFLARYAGAAGAPPTTSSTVSTTSSSTTSSSSVTTSSTSSSTSTSTSSTSSTATTTSSTTSTVGSGLRQCIEQCLAENP